MPRFVLPPPNPGLLIRGTIDIDARLKVAVPVGGGKFASVRTVSWHLEPNYPLIRRLRRPQGAEILVPTVIARNGKWVVVSDRTALNHALSTGRHLGIFDTPAHATKYAIRLHLEQPRYQQRRRAKTR